MSEKLEILKVCRRRGISMNQLAGRCGIPQPSLSRYQKGRSDITLRQMNRIADALSCRISDLLEAGLDFSVRHRDRIRQLEKEALNQDKSWVSGVLWSLQQHYRKVKEHNERPLSRSHTRI